MPFGTLARRGQLWLQLVEAFLACNRQALRLIMLISDFMMQSDTESWLMMHVVCLQFIWQGGQSMLVCSLRMIGLQYMTQHFLC